MVASPACTSSGVELDVAAAGSADHDELYTAFAGLVAAGEGYPQTPGPLSVEEFDDYWLAHDRDFPSDDHRNFNREGQVFDRGETFSGVNFETGLRAADELKELVPEGYTLAQLALRWILMHPAVSCTIPGAKRPEQVESNVAAAGMPPLSEETMQRIRGIYDRSVRPEVHHLW